MKKLFIFFFIFFFIFLTGCSFALNQRDPTTIRRAEEIIKKMEAFPSWVPEQTKYPEEEFLKLVGELEEIGRPALSPIWEKAHTTKNKELQTMLLEIYTQILQKSPNPASTKRLISLLNNKKASPYKRAQSASSLADIGGEGVFEALVSNLSDPDEGVRGSCARALGFLGDKRGGDYLIPLVNDNDNYVRGCAIGALVLLKDERALQILIDDISREADELLRGADITCLGDLGDPRAVPHLIELTKPNYDKTARERAMESLGKIGGDQAVNTLIELLKDKVLTIRIDASRQLAILKDPKAIEPLKEAIRNAKGDFPSQPRGAEVLEEELKKSYQKLTGQEYQE